MKISLNTFSFHFASDVWAPLMGEPRNILWILEKSRQLGARGIDISDMRHFYGAITPDALNERLGVMALSFGTGGCDPDHMREMIGLCSRLGKKVFRTFLGKRINNATISNLKSVMTQAEKAGVRIAIENHQDLTSARLLEVLRRVGSPFLGVTLDTGNALGVLEDPLACAEALAPHVYSTHIKEYAVRKKTGGYDFWCVPVGEGSCSVREQMEILFEKSPWKKEVPLNLEAPVEYARKTGKKAERVADRLEKQGLLCRTEPPVVRRLSGRELLAAEESLVRASLHNLQKMLAAMQRPSEKQ